VVFLKTPKHRFLPPVLTNPYRNFFLCEGLLFWGAKSGVSVFFFFLRFSIYLLYLCFFFLFKKNNKTIIDKNNILQSATSKKEGQNKYTIER